MTIKNQKVYAYVSGENVRPIKAFLPGEEYQGQPVSKHGDLKRWTHGKRATLARVHSLLSFYDRTCARQVCRLLGWDFYAEAK